MVVSLQSLTVWWVSNTRKKTVWRRPENRPQMAEGQGIRSTCCGFLLFVVLLLMLLSGPAAAQGDVDRVTPSPKDVADLKKLIEFVGTLKNSTGGNLKENPEALESLASLILTNAYINERIRTMGLVDFQNFEGQSLLTLAASNGMVTLAKTLLDTGAYVDLMDETGWTSLIWAARNNRTEMVKLLLEYKPDVNIQNRNHGDTALGWAAYNGNVTIVLDLLAAGALTSLPNHKGDTPLLMAARGLGNRVEVVRQLLRYGAGDHVDHQSTLGWTALMWASRKGYIEIVKLLLEAKADPNRRNVNHGDTALGWASSLGYSEIVRELLAAGADPNLKNNIGRTPLGLTITGNASEVASEVARILLAAGADINLQAADGDTALMEAAFREKTEMVRVLLEYCPDLDVYNNNRKTVEQIASQRNDRQIKNMISEHKGKFCLHNNQVHVVGDTRYDDCRQVQCCHGVWTPTGKALSSCGRSCKTVGSPAGICTLIDQCPQLVDQFTLAQDFEAKANFIRIYSCRYRRGEDVQVCCPVT